LCTKKTPARAGVFFHLLGLYNEKNFLGELVMTDKMSSFKPYLFTAYYEWLTDNGITPHLAIDTSVKGVVVPSQYVKDDQIVLSIAPAAVRDYQLKPQGISFKAMFRGVSEDIFVPFKAMLVLIAVEQGQGIPIGTILENFCADEEDDESESDETLVKEPLFSVESEAESEGQAKDESEDTEPKSEELEAPSFEIVKD
jgi:stringent starvation protein B